MNGVKIYIDSGILEMYVLGVTSDEENKAVGEMAVKHPAIQNEIEKISAALYEYMNYHGTKPPSKVRDNLLGLIGKEM